MTNENDPRFVRDLDPTKGLERGLPCFVYHEDAECWLVELLELERESVAAQAAYALRERREDRDGLRPVG